MPGTFLNTVHIVTQVLLITLLGDGGLSPLYKRKGWSPEMFSNLPRVTQLSEKTKSSVEEIWEHIASFQPLAVL